MNHFERLHIAMKRGQPDRVPVMCQLSHGHMERNAGVKPFEMYFSAQGAAQAFLNIRREYDFEGIHLNMAFDINWKDFFESTKIEVISNGERYILPDGRIYEQQGASFIQTRFIDVTYPDIDTLDLSEVEYQLDYTHMMALHKILVEEGRKEKISIHGEVGSPFDYLCFFLGIENAMSALILNPDRCHELLGNYSLQAFALSKAQIDIGIDTMKISSPFAGGSYISKNHYEKFVVPYEKRLVSLIREYSPDTPVYTHTCGFINDRLELMASSGIDGIECMDPPPLGNTLLADAKRRVGGELFLKGNMDSVNVLRTASKDMITEYVKKMIEDGAKGGGYILSTACSVAPEVKPEILRLLVPLAEKYGRYE